jgi:ankyrin repeat protein
MNKIIKLICLSILVITPIHAMQNDAELGKQLVVAAAKGDNNEIEQLIKAGAPIDYENNMGWTALRIAAARGQLNCLQILIARKAQINQPNIYGSTALMQAAQHGELPCVKALIAAGAQLNLANNAGWTALMNALYGGHTSTCELLVNAMLWIPNQKQKTKIVTFLGIAKFRKYLRTIQLDAYLRNEFKAPLRALVYEDNKENFASSIAYQELMKIKESPDMQSYSMITLMEALLEKYNPGGNNSDSQSWC